MVTSSSAALPDSVKIIEVPKHDKYGYVVANEKREIVDRITRKVIRPTERIRPGERFACESA